MAFLPLSHRLLEAGKAGDVALIIKLFKNKVQTEFTDENGNTPLMLAVSHGHVAAAKLLLEHGADIQHSNNLQHRAVHLAAMAVDDEMLVLLLSRGAKLNQPNHEGFLPIQLTHHGSKAHSILFAAQNGMRPEEYDVVNDVPIIPTYSIPVPKVKSDKKDKKKGGKGKTKKKGKKKR